MRLRRRSRRVTIAPVRWGKKGGLADTRIPQLLPRPVKSADATGRGSSEALTRNLPMKPDLDLNRLKAAGSFFEAKRRPSRYENDPLDWTNIILIAIGMLTFALIVTIARFPLT